MYNSYMCSKISLQMTLLSTGRLTFPLTRLLRLPIGYRTYSVVFMPKVILHGTSIYDIIDYDVYVILLDVMLL